MNFSKTLKIMQYGNCGMYYGLLNCQAGGGQFFFVFVSISLMIGNLECTSGQTEYLTNVALNSAVRAQDVKLCSQV